MVLRRTGTSSWGAPYGDWPRSSSRMGSSSQGLRGVVLRGEPGIGKTTLLAAFAQSVVSMADATVVYGRCDETAVPLQPFRSVLADCVEHAPVELLGEHVARCGGELVRICPQLATRVGTAPHPTVSDDATERFLLFEAATDLLRRIAMPRPLVLMFDDLQWAEETALLMLRHITHALLPAAANRASTRRSNCEPRLPISNAASTVVCNSPVSMTTSWPIWSPSPRP